MAATAKAPETTQRMRRRRLGVTILAVVLGASLYGLPVPQAEAGSYIVRECQLVDATAPDAVYTTNGALAFTPDNRCNDSNVGIAIGTQGSGFTGPLHAAWSISAPDGAYLRTANLDRRSFAGGTYAPIVSVCSAGGVCNGYSNNTVGFEPTQYAPGDWSYLSIFIGCGGSPCNAGGHIAVRNLEFTIDDATPPVIGSVGGSLVSGGTKRGVESFTVGA